MPRAGRKKVQRYSMEFKQRAVRLSQLPDVEVQAVAQALDIHPFMLSRWRKEAREGWLRGTSARAKPRSSVTRVLNDLEALPIEHIADGFIAPIEIREAIAALSAGREYQPTDPYVERLDRALEALGPLLTFLDRPSVWIRSQHGSGRIAADVQLIDSRTQLH